jgi:hypothetical protein
VFIVQSLLNEHLAANWVAPTMEGTVPSMLYRPLEAWPLTQLSTPASRVLCQQLAFDILTATPGYGVSVQRRRWEDMANDLLMVDHKMHDS